MTAARHAQIGALFAAALSIPDPAEREFFLTEVTANDPELLDEVRQLLFHHQDTDSFLNLNLMRNSPLPIGAKIGPYTLLEQIGSGGMGMVYRAQGPTHEAALKLIHPNRENEKILARFKLERRLLSLLEHPNIAQIHESGPNFIAMELVLGIPLTNYCHNHNLSVPERLQLLITICRAIQFAHTRSIIHRDLKPANILVTTQGQPKIIDFGLAKALDPNASFTTLTELGTILGTFQYMSPEQALPSSRSVDHRSDVYSLGIILYELLTASPPLDSQSLQNASCPEILHRILTETPPPPTQDPRLNAITLRALAKDPAQRHQSAAELAEDLSAYQSGGA
jgi:eukaryotic-like serine/threonine-protein kinase